MTTTDRTPIILDVDTGIDDSLALLYAAASPEADLLAVTCSSGNVEAADVARNTLGVLELAGRGDVEVAVGRRLPLVRPLEITPETHGPHGIGYAELPEPRRPLSERFGPDVIVEAARRRPGEITLVTLGPLTNLAVALEQEPALPRLLGRWVMMGGAFTVPGNTTPTTEWNVHCDPEAAKVCLDAWGAAVAADPSVPRMAAMGLDVTEKARVLPAHLDALAGVAGRDRVSNPVLRFLDDALRFYFEFHATYDGFYGAFIHDPFVTAAALDPALVLRSEAWSVDVDTAGGAADGLTIADRRGLLGRRPNADVVLEADADEFLRRLVDRVGGLARAAG
ncbi:MAG: nucleoside hydrolase [Chloroflexota bacterium]